MKERRPQEVLSGQKAETTAACYEVTRDKRSLVQSIKWLCWTTTAAAKLDNSRSLVQRIKWADTDWRAASSNLLQIHAASANLGQKACC